MNLLPFRVYQILSEYTDGGHALAMGELLRLLRTEYGLRCTPLDSGAKQPPPAPPRIRRFPDSCRAKTLQQQEGGIAPAEGISHYRVDRIQSPVLLEKQTVEPLPAGLDLARYVRERVYPFPGFSNKRAALRPLPAAQAPLKLVPQSFTLTL